jgi:hypothetical protein
METIERNLQEARTHLQHMQALLRNLRKGYRGNDPLPYRAAELMVCKALDRAWEAQCMAQGSL